MNITSFSRSDDRSLFFLLLLLLFLGSMVENPEEFKFDVYNTLTVSFEKLSCINDHQQICTIRCYKLSRRKAVVERVGISAW